MSLKPRTFVKFAALAFVTGSVLGGCGIRGTLKTPPPIWGEGIPLPDEQSAPDSAADATRETTPNNTAGQTAPKP